MTIIAPKILSEEDEYILYPETDGEPMAETDVHRKQILDLIATLEEFFRGTPDVYVSGNLLVYFQKGDGSASVAPDVFVVKGVAKGERRTYRVWEEEKTPDVVIEISSQSTAFADQNIKWTIYERKLRVGEYFLFDPLKEYLEPPFQGYRLVRGRYRPIPLVDERLPSNALNLELGVKDGWLRLYNPNTKQWLLTPSEQAEALRRETEARRREAEARRQAEERAQLEALARRQAEAELARIQEELRKLRRTN
ncbi:MAG: Uma2 family endonuclease [Candidatus Poribacteria bacterium]